MIASYYLFEHSSQCNHIRITKIKGTKMQSSTLTGLFLASYVMSLSAAPAQRKTVAEVPHGSYLPPSFSIRVAAKHHVALNSLQEKDQLGDLVPHSPPVPPEYLNELLQAIQAAAVSIEAAVDNATAQAEEILAKSPLVFQYITFVVNEAQADARSLLEQFILEAMDTPDDGLPVLVQSYITTFTTHVEGSIQTIRYTVSKHAPDAFPQIEALLDQFRAQILAAMQPVMDIIIGEELREIGVA